MGKRGVFFYWLVDYKWRQYSKLLHGAFYLPCAICGHQTGVNSSKVDKPLVCPFIDLSYAVSRFNMYINSSNHQTIINHANFLS